MEEIMNENKKPGLIYELAFVLRLGESLDPIVKLLKDSGAEITMTGPVTQVQLAHPIAKATAGQLGFYRFTLSDTSALKAMTHALELNEAVLRFLFVKVPKEKPRPVRMEKPLASGKGAEKKPASVTPSISHLDSLSNEKLEETLEEILK